MNIDWIRAIADIFEQKGLTYLEVSEGVASIRLEKKPAPDPAPLPQSPVPEVAPPQDRASAASAAPAADEGLQIAKAPLAGIFYAAPSPDSEPFVKVGTRVKKGDVLCIIEAMKVMNELTSDYDGEVVEICVQNGQIVEFNQPIVKIKP